MRPHVRVDPAQRFGQPNVRGISVDAIAGAVIGEKSVAAAAEDYSLSRGEVLVACWYLGLYGSKRWRKRWKAWAEDAGQQMAHASTVDYSAIPDPPVNEENSHHA